jgi:aspartate racemase
MSTRRLVGLIGGVTWRSTLDYYRLINEETGRRLGEAHSARLLLASLDFHDVRTLTLAGDEPALLELYAQAAAGLVRAGAQALMLCANTAHRRAAALKERSGIPLLHIGDAIGRAALAEGRRTLGLLGTRATMEEPFLRAHLEERFGLDVLTPPADERHRLERAIFEEMAQGRFLPDTAAHVAGLAQALARRGAQAVVLGCTELPILLRDVALPCPSFDSVQLHARAAVEFSLDGVV